MQYKKLPSSCTFFRQKRGREHSEALNVCATFFMLEMWCFMDHDGVFSPSSAMFCRAITFRVFFLCSEYIETHVSKVRLWCFYSFLKQRSFHLQSSASLFQGCFILRTYVCCIVVALTYYMSISINRKGGGVSFWKTKNIKTEEQKSVYPRLSSIADSVPHACAKIF